MIEYFSLLVPKLRFGNRILQKTLFCNIFFVSKGRKRPPAILTTLIPSRERLGYLYPKHEYPNTKCAKNLHPSGDSRIAPTENIAARF
jgi:hypothetical protein